MPGTGDPFLVVVERETKQIGTITVQVKVNLNVPHDGRPAPASQQEWWGKSERLAPPRHGTPWRSDAVVASGSARARGKLSVRTERRARTHPSLAAAELRLPPCRAE
jgi:hypothetical protein